VKKKILMLGSVVAILLSGALLITPASAATSSFCTTCSKLVNGGSALLVSECKTSTTQVCFCPLQPPLFSNTCVPPATADKPLK
jgi:hypothetical protein